MAAAEDISDDAMKVTTFCLNVAAKFATSVLIIVSVLKREIDEAAPPSTPLNAAAAGLYLVYVAPNITSCLQKQGKWYNVMNDAVTAVSMLKTAVDNVNPIASNVLWRDFGSPWLETVINAAWMAPAIGSLVSDPSASNAVGFASNMAFDIGGVLAPATNKIYYPYLDPPLDEAAAGVVFIATQVLSAIYGGLCFAYAVTELVTQSTDPRCLRPAVAIGSSPNRA